VKDFRNLNVWQKAHSLTVDIYKTTSLFPGEELYGLTSQIRRSCSSIPANLAEGCSRSGDAEFGRFLQIALGSASELEYHLLLSHDLKFLNDAAYEKFQAAISEIKRMLTGLIQKTKAGN